MTRRLLIAVHDVAPRFEGEVDRLMDIIRETIERPMMTMLIVPHHWNSEPLRPGTPFATRLRSWSLQGMEIFLHGWTHRDDCRHSGLASLKARHMTAREGEFLGLSRDEALLRMMRGKMLLEDIVGVPVRGFVAPAWLYSTGACEALGEAGFELAEDHMSVWSPVQDSKRLARGPVMTWASRSASRRAMSLAATPLLHRTMRYSDTARIGVHPGDTGYASLLASIQKTLSMLNATHLSSRYDDLLPGAARHVGGQP